MSFSNSAQAQSQMISQNSIRIVFESVQLANAFLQNKTLLDTLQIEVGIPKSLTAVVCGVDMEMSEAEIAMGIDPAYKVVRIYKMTKAVQQADKTFKRVPTKLVHLVFQHHYLPDSIVTHYVRLDVRPKVKSIVQCHKCMRYNHPSTFCKSKVM